MKDPARPVPDNRRGSEESAPPVADARRLRGPLLRWYRRHRRDLPWRRTSDPYAIWVAEVMLQQTQVATVLPYYIRFLDRFPDAPSLARASEEEVLSAWSGLGYYRRARALREGARTVVERHRGRLPGDPRALRELPGIGRYTAGAIASIGFGLREPVLDGNVRRVLSRLFALGDPQQAFPPPEKRLWEIAAVLADGPEPGALNQALMELGALVCTPRNPRCLRCPVRVRCAARADGDPEAYPATRPRRAAETVRVAVALVRRSGRVLLERPGDGNPFRGTWDLPAIELGEKDDPGSRIAEGLERGGLEIRVGDLRCRARHGILHRQLRLEVYDCRLDRGRVSRGKGLRWLAPDGIDRTAVSGATRKVLRLAGLYPAWPARVRCSVGGR